MPSGFCLEIVSKVNGKIKGGSKSKACPEQIEVGAWNWGGIQGRDGFATSKTKNVEVRDVTFTSAMSVASAALMHAAATGDALKTVTLSGRTEGANGDEIIYMQLRFSDAYLSQYAIEGKGSDHPMESFTVHFTVVEILYRQQKPDGSVGQQRVTAFDTATNAMVKPTLGGS